MRIKAPESCLSPHPTLYLGIQRSRQRPSQTVREMNFIEFLSIKGVHCPLEG